MVEVVGRLESVNVGRVRRFERDGRPAASAIWKEPVAGRVRAVGVNLEGDDQADRENHGGVDQAVACALEDTSWWEERLGHPIEPGGFGENLSTRGVDVSGAVVGERWAVGSAVLEVSAPRSPCWKLGLRLGHEGMIRAFRDAGRPGAYLRIAEEGEVGAGDEVRLLGRPAHGLTVAEAAHVYHHDPARAARLLEAPELPADWRRWARERVATGD